MASPTDQVRRSNIVLSWQSDIVKIDNQEWDGITAIGYDETLEHKIQHANRRDAAPVGMTRGKYTPGTLKITMLRDTAARLKQYLAAKGGVGSHGAAEFQVDVQHVEPSQDVISATLTGCRWQKSSRDDKEGNDALTEEVECAFLKANETLNGTTISLYTDSEQP